MKSLRDSIRTTKAASPGYETGQPANFRHFEGACVVLWGVRSG
ncbi:MAG: hypothetical protein AAB074_04460 [Planctomycetota bacterium]